MHRSYLHLSNNLKLQQKNAKQKLEEKSKNDSIGNPQFFHHAKCRTYHDKITADIVQLGDESSLKRLVIRGAVENAIQRAH